MSKLFVLPQMIYWLKKLVCMEEQSRLALKGKVKVWYDPRISLTFERMMNKLLGSLTTEKLLVISFVLTFIVVVAINAWLEAYGLALTLIATNKVSQRRTSSAQLIIREVKVIYLCVLICLRLIFI